MFLDSTFFQGELYLPNLRVRDDAVGVGRVLQVVGENNLQWFVDKYEREGLSKILGHDLSRALIKGMQEGDPLWEPLFQIIYRRESCFSYSPLANYVYYMIRRSAKTQTTMKGEVVQTQDNAQVVSEGYKLCQIWNDMLHPIDEIRRYIFKNWNVFQEYADRECVCSYRFRPINTMNI